MSNLILERPPGVKELICDLSNVSTPVTVIPHNRPSNYTGNPHSDDGLYRVHYVHYYPLSWEEIEFIKVRPRFAPSQWETALLCNDVSHWLSATIPMTPHEHQAVSNHRLFDCLFNSLRGPTSKKHQSLRYSLFVRGIHRWPLNSSHKGPVTYKMFPSDDVIMLTLGMGQNGKIVNDFLKCIYLYEENCYSLIQISPQSWQWFSYQ